MSMPRDGGQPWAMVRTDEEATRIFAERPEFPDAPHDPDYRRDYVEESLALFSYTNAFDVLPAAGSVVGIECRNPAER